MDDTNITITLDKVEWISLAKFLTRNIGKMVDIMPAARLIEALMNAGIKTSEIDPAKK